MTYSEFQNNPSTEKIGLVILHASQLLKGWALYSGSIYSIPYQGVIFSIEDSGVAINEVADLGSVVANSFYFDRTNSIIYLRTSDSVNPNGKFIVLEEKRHFSNVTVMAPHDLDTGYEVLWTPLLDGTSSFGVELDNQNQFGLALDGSGTVSVINDQDYWQHIFDKLIFENKKCFIYSWNRSLAFSEARLIYRGAVDRKSYDAKKISFRLKDLLNELRNPIELENLEDYFGGRVSDAYALAKQRRIYGYVFGHRPSNIDMLIDGKYPISGTVSATSGSATVTGSGTAFLDELSPNDDIYIGDDTVSFTVESVASDTSMTLTENYSQGTKTAVTAEIRPSHAKKFMNRRFLVAGHQLRKPSATVTNPISLRVLGISNTTDFIPGSEITINGEVRTVLRISVDKVFLTSGLVNLPLIGDTIEVSSAQNLFLNDRKLVKERDYTIDASNAVIELDTLAEFNIAPIRSLVGTVSFTSSSRAVTGSGTTFKNDLKSGDWIKAVGQGEFFEVLSVEDDASLTLRTASTYTASTDCVFKSPDVYADGAVVLSCDALGKTEDGLTSGVFLKRSAQIVEDILLESGISASDIDSASFDLASDLAEQRVGVVIPSKVSDKRTPIVRDAVNNINKSVFGSLIQTNEFKLKYNILSPKRTITALKLSEKDILSFKIDSRSENVVKTVRVEYRNKEYDAMIAQAGFTEAMKQSNEGSFLVKTNKEFILNSVLVDQNEAQYLANRFAFLFKESAAAINIETKLQASLLEINDKIIVDHEKFYERVGSNEKRKIAAVSAAKRSIFDSQVKIEDLSNAFTRCGVITTNTNPTYDASTDDQRILAGYITDNYGMMDNDPGTYGIHEIW